MKSLNQELAAHLASGTTTLCWCWKITRSDGLVLGFTDHDAPLFIAATRCEAMSGFSASEVQSGLDLSVDNLTVQGALSSQSLNEDDLAAGLFDNAAIEIWRVNWAAPDQRVLLRKGVLGEVKRGKTGFAAEIRGLAQVLNQSQGRVFGHGCDAVLGDARCRVVLTPVPATVSALRDNRQFSVSGLSTYASGWFSGGKLSFTSGANQGRAMEIKRHTLAGGVAGIELWHAMSATIVVGDGVSLTPGCDHQFATCKTKFANAANFRGAPYMPGTGAVLAAAASSTPLDGKSRYGN